MQRSSIIAVNPVESESTNSPINRLISHELVKKHGAEISVPVFFNSITALKEYEIKSLEELRFEDYCLNRKYSRIVPPPFRPTVVLQEDDSDDEVKNPLKQKISTDGTRIHKYKSVLGVDFKYDKLAKITFPVDTNLTHINSMLEYENMSPEELRFYDYTNGLKCKVKENKNDKNNNEDESLPSCPICLETIIQLKKDGIRLNVSICGHVICKKCTEQLVRNANRHRLECPSCRKNLRTTEIHELFI